MTEPELNVDLLDKVYKHIVDHEAMWNQNYWALKTTDCGTQHCFAGFAAVLSGAQIFWQGDHTSTSAKWCVTPEGENVGIADYAQEELGLTGEEYLELFYAPTDLFALSKVMNDIKDGKYRG